MVALSFVILSRAVIMLLIYKFGVENLGGVLQSLTLSLFYQKRLPDLSVESYEGKLFIVVVVRDLNQLWERFEVSLSLKLTRVKIIFST